MPADARVLESASLRAEEAALTGESVPAAKSPDALTAAGDIGLGDRNDDGTRNVQFELNGMRREVSVPDPTATDSAKTVVMADPNDKSQAGASIPGMVSKVNVKPGDQVKVNDVLAVIEAMKMETSVVARMDGTIDEVFVKGGQTVKAGELLLTIK